MGKKCFNEISKIFNGFSRVVGVLEEATPTLARIWDDANNNAKTKSGARATYKFRDKITDLASCVHYFERLKSTVDLSFMEKLVEDYNFLIRNLKASMRASRVNFVGSETEKMNTSKQSYSEMLHSMIENVKSKKKQLKQAPFEERSQKAEKSFLGKEGFHTHEIIRKSRFLKRNSDWKYASYESPPVKQKTFVEKNSGIYKKKDNSILEGSFLLKTAKPKIRRSESLSTANLTKLGFTSPKNQIRQKLNSSWNSKVNGGIGSRNFKRRSNLSMFKSFDIKK